MKRRTDASTLLLGAVAVAAGAVVLTIATELFPHHSANHDEGVYLQQARLLLDGRLWFTTALPDAFHWWFFVEDGPRLYGRYQPVVPAMFAVGLAADTPRLVLALVGAGVVALVGHLTREAYDGPTGVAAAVLVVASPLYLLATSVFLPYAPTTLLNLLFAYGYVRLLRTGRRRWAILSGTVVGLAFAARPYTAVLFALPFVVHALVLLWTARADPDALRWRLRRLLPVAALGTLFVVATLSYNVVVTGDPLLFPYQAFGPADGVGFGHRELLGYSVQYTPGLALRAHGTLLWEFATRFVAAPPAGALLAGLGICLLGVRLWRVRDADAPSSLLDPDDEHPLPDSTLRLLFAGVLAVVVVGNVPFWGTLNALDDLADPTDGLVAQFGPMYHYDLLLPLSAFGAAGLAWLARTVRSVATPRVGRRRALAVVLGLALVATPALAVAEEAALDTPVAEHRAYTERYASAYEPFEGRTFDDALVFVPTPFGEWLGHPFQSLQNDPELAGDAVYALDRAPGDDFRVLDAYPRRTTYRYTFRGDWTEAPPEPVVAHLQPIAVRSGSGHRITFETGAVGRPSTVRISRGDDAATVHLNGSRNGSVTVGWLVEPGTARIVSPAPGERGSDTVSFDGSAELSLAVTYVQTGGATVTYRQELAVEERGDRVRVIWPPEVEVCRLRTDCGHEGMFVPGGEYLAGVSVNQSIRAA